MQVFIDEAGNFTPSSGWSVVCSLCLPDREIGPARRKLAYISRDWPRLPSGELKGGMLRLEHLRALVELLYERDALLHTTAIDVASEDAKELAVHKQKQCEGHTNQLTPEHSNNVVQMLWSLRRDLEKMPMQLYLQSVSMSELVQVVIEETTAYFSQRRPKELASFKWSIDAKDPLKVTTQEQWWRETLGPLLESACAREPWSMVADDAFNYYYFERAFQFQKFLWRPDRERELITGYDIKKIISSKTDFCTSDSDILLQAVDILTNFTRRLLNKELTDLDVARIIGRIQIRRRRGDIDQSIHLITLSRTERRESSPLGQMLGHMARSGRSMIRPDRKRLRQAGA